MSEPQKAFSYIDAKSEEMKKLWIDISKIESPSEYKPGIDKVSELLADICKRSGLATKIITFENSEEKSGSIGVAEKFQISNSEFNFLGLKKKKCF